MRSAYHDHGWQHLSDEELTRWLAMYRLRRANYATEMDPAYLAEGVEFLDLLIADGSREQARRRQAGLVPVPPRFDPAFLGDLKARIALDELCAYELGARLGPLRHGKRRGACPICKAGEKSGSQPFVVFVADAGDQHYLCYACRACGDAISAMIQAYGDPFPVAVERLCRYGQVPLPDVPAPIQRVQRPPEYLQMAR